MDRKKTPLSIEIIYWFTNITLGMLALVSFAFFLINIYLYSSDDQDEFGFSLSIPIKFELKEMGTIQLNEQNVKIKLVDASSKVFFMDVPRSVSRTAVTFALFLILFVFYLVWVFREFIKNVKEGNVFIIKNILLLKRISYLLVVVWLFQDVVMQLIYFYLVKRMEFENVSLIKDFRVSIDFFNYRSVLFVAIFIWVLAHIFMTGLKLQEDKDLTI